MLKINTKKFDPNQWPEGVWGTYAPGAKLKIRKVSADVFIELRKPFIRTEMQAEKGSHRMVPVEKLTDEEGYNDKLTDYIIEDQEGFGNEEGQAFPTPLDLASKKALMNDLQIKDWIWAFSQSQESTANEKREEEIKK